MPGKSYGQRSLVGCGSWGHTELDTPDTRVWYFSLRCTMTDFPGGPVVKTPRFHCWGHGFSPSLGNQDPVCIAKRLKNNNTSLNKVYHESETGSPWHSLGREMWLVRLITSISSWAPDSLLNQDKAAELRASRFSQLKCKLFSENLNFN